MKKLLIGLIVLSIASVSQAALVYGLGEQSTSASDGWNDETYWSDGLVPSAGNDYIITNGAAVTTDPHDTETFHQFAGDSLQVHAGGSINVKNQFSSMPYNMNNLILDGGTIAMRESALAETRYVEWQGTMTIRTNSTVWDTSTGGRRQYFVWNNTWYGSADLSTDYDYTGGTTNKFTADLSNFTGDLVINENFQAQFDSNPNSAGGLVVTTGGELNFQSDVTFWTVNIGGTDLTPGTYTAVELETSYGSYFDDSSTGGLTVAIPEPTTAGIAVIGAFLVAARLRRRKD